MGITGLPLARACLAAGAHYVDQANELEPVQQLLELDAEARGREVTLLTGAGFGVLATEALVVELRGGRSPAARAMVAALPAVQRLGSSVLASAVDAIAYGGRRYRGLRNSHLIGDHPVAERGPLWDQYRNQYGNPQRSRSPRWTSQMVNATEATTAMLSRMAVVIAVI
jgi:hypothetical protein